jgi:SAM-dependent methyltransferase
VRLSNPKPGTQFVRHRGRLALFHSATPHIDYWREYWTPEARQQLMTQGRSGSLGEFEGLLDRYARRDLPFLEAGCGPAHLVAAMTSRGFDASGVDYEPDVVRFVNEVHPDLQVREGDVLSLDHASESIGTYMSVGVIEHFEDGPERALQEARRVLHPNGVALISVPYLNPARRSHLAEVPTSPPAGMSFHQYYFDVNSLRALLAATGLDLIDTHPYAVEAFLTRERPLVRKLWNSKVAREPMKRSLRSWFAKAPGGLRRRNGHMLMTVSSPH